MAHIYLDRNYVGVLVLIGRSGLNDTVEVAVVEGAVKRNDAVVTSNRPGEK